MPAMPHATGERHTRPGAGAEGGASRVPGFAPRARWSTPIHGIAAANAHAAHRPIDQRHPAASATGTAARAGNTVPIWTPTM